MLLPIVWLFMNIPTLLAGSLLNVPSASHVDVSERAACSFGDALTCKYCRPPPVGESCKAWRATFDDVRAGQKITADPPDEYGWYFFVYVEDPKNNSHILPQSSPNAAYDSEGTFKLELNVENNISGNLAQLYFACAHAGKPASCMLFVTATCGNNQFTINFTYTPKLVASYASMKFLNWTNVVHTHPGQNLTDKCSNYLIQAGATSGPQPALYLDNIIFTATAFD